jgi:putative intracellular protease/amidase
MAGELRGKRVAVLVENGFEESELLEPKKAPEQAGAKVDVVSPQATEVKGWQRKHWGQSVHVDRQRHALNPRKARQPRSTTRARPATISGSQCRYSPACRT